MLPTVAIYFTGGTISMASDRCTGGAVPVLSGLEILARVPELASVANLHVIDYPCLPGPNWTGSLMLELAQGVKEQLSDPAIAGAVIVHGTDTLEETAYLLDIVLAEDKPVVFVGSLRHSSELSWDGPGNLFDAVRVAASSDVRGLGVLVVMAGRILAAADATKTHTSALDAFHSRDFGPIGLVDSDRLLLTRRQIQRRHVDVRALEERVDLIRLTSGDDGRFIGTSINMSSGGIVLEGTGRGNVPVTAVPAIEKALGIGIVVVLTSRCPHGRTLDVYAYEGSGQHLRRLGVILGGALPGHKARLLLMALLGAGVTPEGIRRAFEDSR